MTRRQRIRRVVKWCGTCLCAVMLAVWCVSYFKLCSVSVWRSSAYCQRGGAVLSLHTDHYPAPNGLGAWLRHQLPAPLQRMEMGFGFLLAEHSSGGWHLVIFPIWMPFLVLAVPTTVFWWLDRRRTPPGHCQNCGYNLTGNVTGRCSECGTPTPSGPAK
jgi:hypothetical protein